MTHSPDHRPAGQGAAPDAGDDDVIALRTTSPGRLEKGAIRLGRLLLRAGLPPRRLGWRAILTDRPLDRPDADPRVEILEPPARTTAPLPRNVPDRAMLSDDRGWWGFSRRDVPARAVAPTCLVRIEGATVASFRSDRKRNYEVGFLDGRGRAVHLPQACFGPGHAALLRRAPPTRRVARATWIAERCYDNHSHWLTAHLPKLLYLREHGLLGELAMPGRRPAGIDASLAAAGFDPAGWIEVDPMTRLEVDALTVLTADRFRPALLEAVRRAHLPDPAPATASGRPTRKVLISRNGARGRKLLEEGPLWEVLRPMGFERVEMERLDYSDQVRLMQETALLLAPHGAGLTNMIFCAAGTHVVEIADTGYPNPNFYALAAAMGHPYWLIDAKGVGPGHALDRDLSVAPKAVLDTVARIRAEIE